MAQADENKVMEVAELAAALAGGRLHLRQAVDGADGEVVDDSEFHLLNKAAASGNFESGPRVFRVVIDDEPMRAMRSVDGREGAPFRIAVQPEKL